MALKKIGPFIKSTKSWCMDCWLLAPSTHSSLEYDEYTVLWLFKGFYLYQADQNFQTEMVWVFTNTSDPYIDCSLYSISIVVHSDICRTGGKEKKRVIICKGQDSLDQCPLPNADQCRSKFWHWSQCQSIPINSNLSHTLLPFQSGTGL